MKSITDVIQRFKQDWVRELCPQAIRQACQDAGMTWRESTLNPVVTVQLFMLQILYGNTACAHLPRLAKLSFSAAAYCKARIKLKLEVLAQLLACATSKAQEGLLNDDRWFGHRVFFVDGSSFSMPDTLALQKHFGQPGGQRAGCGFPTSHWLVMMHAGTGMIIRMFASALRTHEMSKTVDLHPELQAGDVLVADRGFCSYAHLALLLQRGVHGLLRIHQRQIVDFTPGRPHAPVGKGRKKAKKGMPRSRWLKKLGPADQQVEWFKQAKPAWMTAQQFARLPDSIVVRELRYTIQQPGFRPREITLVTTLLGHERYPQQELEKLFLQRWEIETNFGHLKTTMKMDVLKCTTVEGVLKELHVFALIYNLVRQIMLTASRRQQVDVRRISFIDALRWLQTAEPDDDIPVLAINPHRPNRLEPRVRKRRPKQYSLMKKPRRQLKKELASK